MVGARVGKGDKNHVFCIILARNYVICRFSSWVRAAVRGRDVVVAYGGLIFEMGFKGFLGVCLGS